MTIFRPHDAGTEFRLQPHEYKPGLDLGRYIHSGGQKNWEFYFYELANTNIQERINASIQTRMNDFRSWAPGMPNQAWIDRTSRHYSIEGYYWLLWQRDEITGSLYKCPAAHHTWIDPTYEPPIVDPSEVTSRARTPSEVATSKSLEGEDPSQYVRAPLQNETEYSGMWSGYTHLKDPLVVDLSRAYGPNRLIEIPASCLLWAPQHWGKPEWYQCETADGEVLEPTEQWLCLRPGGKYRVHMRPRLWRWEIFVLAHYVYVTLFGMILNDEYFTHIYYDRPPFYPYRHNVIQSKASQGYWNWNNQPRSYDPGIDYAWERSNAAADLSRQMLEQQYTAPSLVYMFLGNEDPDVYLEAWAARKSDIVAVIERTDEATGSATSVFVRQTVNLDSVYTDRKAFGAYIARWQVHPTYGAFG